MPEKETGAVQYSLDIIAGLSERVIRRLWVVIIVLAVLLCATNTAWLAYMVRYDFESYTISSEGGGNANYIGQDGDIYNGKNNSPAQDTEKS